MSVRAEELQRGRTRLLFRLAVGAVVVLLVIAGLIWAGSQTAPPTTTTPFATDPAVRDSASPPDNGWDVAAQTALATRPMRAFPDSAALRQTLAATEAAPALVVPSAGRRGAAVPGDFPPTAAGAVGQLAALLVVGLRDINPSTFAQAYRSISLPRAPDPAVTPLGRDVERFYGQAVTAASEPGPVTSRWQLAGALIKGTTDAGRYVVVCVVGELQAAKTNSVSAGTADCQAMRWTGADWRISPGAVAARAPVVWPGSEASVLAGYRPTTGGGG